MEEKMETPGTLLRQRREARKLSLKQVSKETKINERYLEALEDERPDVFPGEVYLRGFLRNYAKFLGLDPEEIISLYEDEGLIEHSDKKTRVDVSSLLEKQRLGLFGRIKGWLKVLIGWPRR